MKKLLPLIIAVFAFGRVAAQSIPNANFDSWNNITWTDPQYYSTSNDQNMTKVPGFTANVTQVAPWTLYAGNGVQMTTEVVNGDTIPGYITNSIGNPLNGKGGIPYNQKPTKLLLWYNCNIVAGDSGLIGIWFKQGGIVKASYSYTVTGSNNKWPELNPTFTPALSFTPDTVIFAAVSSSDAIRGKNGFAGSTMTLSEVEFQGAGNPTDLNGEFNPWVTDTAFAPTGWTVLYPGSTRSTDAYTGDTYALQLVTTLNLGGGSQAVQGFATTGMIENQSLVGGYPYTQTNDSLQFYYTYAPELGDSATVQLEFKSGGTLIGVAQLNLGAASSYTWVNAPFTVGSTPDSVIVSFFSSLTGTIPASFAGSTLQVDNVQFASQQTATAVKPVLMANNSLLIYPNPASNQITVNSAQLAVNEVRLDNILGETFFDKTYSSGVAGLKENIDVSNLPSGLYFITITSGNVTSTGKIMVSR